MFLLLGDSFSLSCLFQQTTLLNCSILSVETDSLSQAVLISTLCLLKQTTEFHLFISPMNKYLNHIVPKYEKNTLYFS